MMLINGRSRLAAGAVAFGLSALASGQPCSLRATEFSVGIGVESAVHALLERTTPGGREIIIGGTFLRASLGNFVVPLNRIGRWNGESFEAFGAGLPATVFALSEFDFGAGPVIVAGGAFDGGVRMWNGTAWELPGGASIGGTVKALATFDADGAGPAPVALYATGSFAGLGSIARWNGSAWEGVGPLANGAPSQVDLGNAMLVFDDGNGPKLYVGGCFQSVGGVAALSIARFDGVNWEPVGAGFGTTAAPGVIFALTVFDAGSGPRLFAGGAPVSSGVTSIPTLARLEAGQWIPEATGSFGQLTSLATYQDVTGSRLYASFTASPVVRRRGATTSGVWEAMPPFTVSTARANALLSTGDGRLLIGATGGLSSVLQFDGLVVSPLSSAFPAEWIDQNLPAPQVFTQTPSQPGLSGLFQAGLLTGSDFCAIGRWDGDRWEMLERTRFLGVPQALAVHTDASGTPALFALGMGLRPLGANFAGFARWNPGSGWSFVPQSLSGSIRRARSVTLGGASELFATGSNTRIVPDTVGGVLRWNGTGFETFPPAFTGEATDLLVYDDGSGEALYLSVNSLLINGVADRFVVRRVGGAWQPLEANVRGRANTLAIFNDGSGPALYAAGQITLNPAEPTAVGVGVFRWNGSRWQRVTAVGGISTTLRLTAFDDGNGEALWLSGNFNTVGSLTRRGLSYYRGGYWWPTPLDSSQSSPISVTPAPGPQPRIYLTGSFNGAQSRRYTPSAELIPCPRPACAADVDDGSGNGVPDNGITVDDLTFFLDRYELGAVGADVDDGTGRNIRDAAVTIDDLLYYLQRYSQGC